MKRSFALMLEIAALGVSTSGLAATRTVCWQLKTLDYSRTECPRADDQNLAGVSRPCRKADDDAIGFRVQLMDKDSVAANDDTIGIWTHSYPGWTCAAFEWENASYAEGEADPDVYLIVLPQVTRSDRDGSVKNIVADGYPGVSGRNGTASNSNLLVANNCKAGQTCYIYPNGWMYAHPDETTLTGQAYLALDSAQRFIQVYYESMDNAAVHIQYPVQYDPNSGTGSCNAGAALDRYHICLPGESDASTDHCGAINGRLLGHELGHALHMQLFEQDSLYVAYKNGGWGPNIVDYERAATAEGWAIYTAAVQWWNPDNMASLPVSFGHNIENAVPEDTSSACATVANAGYALQVAKAFWDLDDANNEYAAAPATVRDSTNLTTLGIAAIWDNFVDGTANHQDREMSLYQGVLYADPYGVNMRDFAYADGLSDSEVLNHNCLHGQTTY